MGEQQQWSLEGAVQSYALWWREAGLHTAVDGAHGWRETLTPFWQRAQTISAPQAPMPAPVQVAAAAPAPAPAVRGEMPGTLPGFLDWLAQDASQPEASWDGALILPPAAQDARLAIVIEMPAPGALDAASLLEPGQRRFLDAMLSSLGMATDDVAILAMATRRPPGGLLDEATLTRLATRMTHYLGLARPKSAIILGDRTSRALLGAQWSPRAESLPIINHQAGTMRAVALASLDLLMSRPMAKARSWQALRMLHGALNA